MSLLTEVGAKGACCFCGRPFSEFQRSNEHVIPRWLLARTEVRITDKHRSIENNHDNEVVHERVFGAHSVKFNKVCASCNNGWMADLERKVQPLLERFLSRPEGEITLAESFAFSNWMFKTMALLHLVQANERRTLLHYRDLQYFYSNGIPYGHGDLQVYKLKLRAEQKLHVYLPRMLYGSPAKVEEVEVEALRRCFVSFLQVDGVLFRYIYRSPPNRWHIADAERIPSRQHLWPLLASSLRWELDEGYLPELTKEDYIVPLLLDA